MNANFLRAMKQYEELRNGPPQPRTFPERQSILGQGLMSAYGYAPPAHAADPYAAQHHQQAQPPHDPYAGQQYAQQLAYPQQPQHQSSHDSAQYSQHSHQQEQYAQQPQAQPYQATPAVAFPQAHQAHQEPTPGQFYQHQAASQASLHRAPTGAPDLPPSGPQRNPTLPGAAGIGAGRDSEAEHRAAWDAYYAQQAHQQAQQGQVQPQDGLSQQPYGASPYPVQPEQGQPQHGQWPQQRAVSNGSVENLAGGVNKMTVHGQ